MTAPPVPRQVGGVPEPHYGRAVLEDPLVPLPAVGRVFRARRRVRLADASPSRRLRLDACARYLQDIGNDDTADSGLDALGGVWVVRRALVDVVASPRWTEWLDLATWCSGTGGRWAGRRLSVTGDQGGRIEVDTLWVHLDAATLGPARLPALFTEVYGPAAADRRISAKRWLAPPPTPATLDGQVEQRMAWPLRATDFDVMGHVNNAAYWVAIEEVLAAHRGHPAHPSGGGAVRAVLEFGTGIPHGAAVELVVHPTDTRLDVWFVVDGAPTASARLFPHPRH